MQASSSNYFFSCMHGGRACGRFCEGHLMKQGRTCSACNWALRAIVAVREGLHCAIGVLDAGDLAIRERAQLALQVPAGASADWMLCIGIQNPPAVWPQTSRPGRVHPSSRPHVDMRGLIEQSRGWQQPACPEALKSCWRTRHSRVRRRWGCRPSPALGTPTRLATQAHPARRKRPQW